jgi:membrane-associated phospholipid phosphatase
MVASTAHIGPRAALTCALVLLAGSAAAQDRPAGPYAVDWTTDGAIIAGAGALWLFTPLLQNEVIRPVCPCSSALVSPFDRYPIGRKSNFTDQLSNAAEAAVVAGPLLLDALDVRRSGASWRGYAEDMLVLAEVLAINGALNQLVKLSVRRPRPTVYDVPATAPDINDSGNYVAFYSGHTSTAFAAGMAYATTFALRHPDSRSRGQVYGVAAVAAGTVGVMRVVAGQHFPSDVLAGALVGSALGLVIPRLHRARSVTLTPAAGGAAVSVIGRF